MYAYYGHRDEQEKHDCGLPVQYLRRHISQILHRIYIMSASPVLVGKGGEGRAALQQLSGLGEGAVSVAGNDDMVENLDAQEITAFTKAMRDFKVI